MTQRDVRQDARLYERLKWPEGHIDVVIDTDTYNEIDDQFAIAYGILSPEKMTVKGIYAAPFHNDRSSGPADGMEKSYHEICKVLKLLDREDMLPAVYRGSDRYLPSETEPVESKAARQLIALSKAYTAERPLYVAALGAITNLASALLMDPSLAERIVIVWLGSHTFEIGHTKEFNLMQDVAAARVVRNSKVPLVLLPAGGGTSHLLTTKPELEYWLKDENRLCEYLLANTVDYCGVNGHTWAPTWSKVIWDIAAIAWLVNEHFTNDRIIPAPIFQYDHHYTIDPEGHPMRYVYWWDRDKIYEDLFTKLTGHPLKERER